MKTYKKPLTLILFLLMAINFSWQGFYVNLDSQEEATLSFASTDDKEEEATETTQKYNLQQLQITNPGIKNLELTITNKKDTVLGQDLKPVKSEIIEVKITELEADGTCGLCILNEASTFVLDPTIGEPIKELNKKLNELIAANPIETSDTKEQKMDEISCSGMNDDESYFGCLNERYKELLEKSKKLKRYRRDPNKKAELASVKKELEDIENIIEDRLDEIYKSYRDGDITRKELSAELKVFKDVKNKKLRGMVRSTVQVERFNDDIFAMENNYMQNNHSFNTAFNYCNQRRSGMGMQHGNTPLHSMNMHSQYQGISDYSIFNDQNAMYIAQMYGCNTQIMHNIKQKNDMAFKSQVEMLPLNKHRLNNLKSATDYSLTSYIDHYNGLRNMLGLRAVNQDQLGLTDKRYTVSSTSSIVNNNLSRYTSNSFWNNQHSSRNNNVPTRNHDYRIIRQY